MTRDGKVHGLYRGLQLFLAPVLRVFWRRHWEGGENLPREGGFILAPNHMSNIDPIHIGYLMVDHGVELRYLGKDSIFKVPLLGRILLRWGMVPVARGSSGGGDALRHARKVILEGEAVGIYPEGTHTRDPAFWPMTLKTGAARLALDTKAPIVPVVQWGPQDFLGRGAKFPRLFPRTDMYAKILQPLDLSDVIDKDSSDFEAVREVTHRLEMALMQGSADLRGEVAPRKAWNMQEQGPDRAALKSLGKWRRQLAKRSRRQDVLAAEPSVKRGRQ